jgi:hypothetical protein
MPFKSRLNSENWFHPLPVPAGDEAQWIREQSQNNRRVGLRSRGRRG